ESSAGACDRNADTAGDGAVRNRGSGRSRGARGIWSALAAVALMVVATGSARAQLQTPFPSWPSGALEPPAVGPRGETVFGRPRPDYDPLGIRQGSFLLYPSGAIAETYDSNVFATQTGGTDDFYTRLIPALTVKSDWNQHALGLTLSGEVKKYAHHTTEDVNNFSSDAVGRYDIRRGEYISVEGIYQLLHEDRSSPNSLVGAKVPTEYHVMGGDLSYVRELGRLGLRIDSAVTGYDFNNNSTATGVVLPQNFRDRIEYAVAPRLTYEIVPGYNAFVRVVGNERQYFSQEPGAGPHGENVRRNSHGWEVDAGTAIELTSITAAELYIGYLHQDYENPLLKSVSGPSFGGSLIWNVTPIDTIRASFSEAVGETTLTGASSTLETGFSATAEHELLTNLLLLASLGFVHDDYQWNPRKDDTYGANVGARYLLNRNWTASADLTYSKRASNVPGGNYDRVIGTLGVKLGF
ncbi:MAG: outer membrane beta-barrel protein, partial [Terriglobales bacterium]